MLKWHHLADCYRIDSPMLRFRASTALLKRRESAIRLSYSKRRQRGRRASFADMMAIAELIAGYLYATTEQVERYSQKGRGEEACCD